MNNQDLEIVRALKAELDDILAEIEANQAEGMPNLPPETLEIGARLSAKIHLYSDFLALLLPDEPKPKFDR